MPRRQLTLMAEERQALLNLRDHALLPYVRERAAALIKVADGIPAAVVAREGLLRPREPDTVYAWLDRYQGEGLAGLTVRTGRGRKPAFSPSTPDAGGGPERIAAPVPARPRACGIDRTRSTLATPRGACQWLNDCTLSGVQRVLKRLKVVWKRARAAIRSPDPDYEAKWAEATAAGAAARAAPGRLVAVYLDEVTVERQPTLAHAYAPTGHDQARASLSHRANTEMRVVAALDALTGRVIYRWAAKITVAVLVQFYQALRAAYPEAEQIQVIEDNWPVHTHPDVLVALQPQSTRWPWYRPPNWPTTPSAAARKKWGALQLPIQIVPLPTYASCVQSH